MGNTIRREPVNFNIPDSPNYKFLNIANFRGLDVSSNPFELATNTASDCLNVYVDETNTLTTRPRLEKKELKDGSGKDIVPLVGRCVGIYSLHDGYLFHWSHQMKILHGDTLTDVLVETMPLTPCKCFEQGDKIYLLGEGRYMVIDENGILNDVEGYVPTRSVVAIDGSRKDVDGLNLLSDKYVDVYFWDGIENPFPQKTFLDYTNAKNNAIKEMRVLNTFEEYEPVLIFNDKSILMKNKQTNYLFHGFLVDGFTDIKTIPTNILVDSDAFIDAALDSKDILVCDKNAITLYTYKGGSEWDTEGVFIRSNTTDDPNYPTLYKEAHISPTGDTVWYLGVAGGLAYTLQYSHIKESAVVGDYVTTFDERVLGAIFTNEHNDTYGTLFYIITKSLDDATMKHVYFKAAGGSYAKIQTFESTTDALGRIASDDIYYNYYSDTDKDILYVINRETKIKTKQVYEKNFISKYFKYDKNKERYYWLDSENILWVAPSNEPENYYNTFVKIEGNVFFNPDIEYFITENASELRAYVWDKDNPTIQITQKITPVIDDYDDWLIKKELFFKSELFTRFDNNYWFASGNTYFRSQNNDPTYFPITEYSELGDSNEDITGFNIANDTTLLAYKPSRLYLIQPFYSETTGMTEYSKTESKNTVGNTAIDAPIVTTLTEIPLQINNDGVYGLSQVSNVSAVERIADLMSEPINDRWLNEDDTIIKKAMTLNRLYWTYIILPYTKDNKTDPRDVTKIYLLDNRTNSWYYWELPIMIINAFVKDNRAEFVDINGDIFYLTTTDIVNKSFDTQLVTEYYDYGKVLIPWLWQSQVLYLGTMNYAKRLVNTTFILTDTDTQDGYGLQYSFKVFRKLASAVPEKELSGDLTLVRSTTKKTNISKFGFLQIKLSNITEDSQGTEAEKAYRNNKLRLVGLGLKYVLLEGLIR